MRKIKIFVAGSKDLSRERDAIKILANDLNSLYNAEDVMIIIHSYEHFSDNQEDYNRFITDEADIVIFILDGQIGDKTEEEFMKATESFNSHGRPEVMVFLREFEKMSGDIGRIQGLIAARLGNRYYVDYAGLSDLKSKARERIVRFIERGPHISDKMAGDKEEEAHYLRQGPERKTSFASSVGLKKISLVFLALLFIVAGLLCWSLLKTDDILIFTGGGSAKNFIMQQTGVDVEKYPNSIYTNLASGTAWDMLMEEANRYQEESNANSSGYAIICLSAADIDSAYFINEKTKGMFHNSRIVRYRMGLDNLVVYVHNDIIQNRHLQNAESEITSDSLRSLIRYAAKNPGSLRLFTTSRNSGTLRSYQSLMEPSDSIDLDKMLETKKSYLFYQNSTSSYLNVLDQVGEALPYVILGSSHYGPNKLESEKPQRYTKLTVVSDGEPVGKPINVYFLGYFNGTSDDNLKVKKEVVRFLETIDAKYHVDTETWDALKSGYVRAAGGHLVQPLN